MALALRNPDFAVLCGFDASAPLLSRVWGMEPGIVHLVGKSGSGKSTAQKGVAALIGSAEAPSEATSYMQAWRVTENAIEAPLEARSDAPSLYDELHSLPAKTDLLSLLYAVANGRGKGRMTKDIEARIVKVWKTQIISSGEKSFADRLRQDGAEDMPGGLKFRVVDVHIGATPFWSDVEQQSADGTHGIYEPLVAKSKSSAGTAQARVIEAIEQGFLEHYGHFWERWILKLQTTEGLIFARKCWDSERASLIIPKGASPIYARRSKHVAASITGLLGILDICRFDQALHDLILTRARKWAIEHLWSSGLDNIYSSEEGDIYDKFITWMVSNEQLLFNVNDPTAFPKANLGWIDKKGGAALTIQGLKELCARHLKMDLGRLQQALEKNGWECARKRHPRAGSESHPMSVWFKTQIFHEHGTDKSA
jgi:energy-coupling factor transporter ATP-binding protein EcfA2